MLDRMLDATISVDANKVFKPSPDAYTLIEKTLKVPPPAYARRSSEVVAAMLGEVGNTGASYGTHLHLEVHQNGAPADPIPFLRERGVDIKLQVESVYAGMAAAAS